MKNGIRIDDVTAKDDDGNVWDKAEILSVDDEKGFFVAEIEKKPDGTPPRKVAIRGTRSFSLGERLWIHFDDTFLVGEGDAMQKGRWDVERWR